MARTKQTARKATGGEAPRQAMAPSKPTGARQAPAGTTENSPQNLFDEACPQAPHHAVLANLGVKPKPTNPKKRKAAVEEEPDVPDPDSKVRQLNVSLLFPA
jgi:hypothetical protein